MKKLLSFMLAIFLLLSLTACNKSTETSNPDPVTDETETVDKSGQASSDEAFYKKMTESSSRPVAVMIDNDSNAARPQSGLEDAFAVYEIKVEGVASRMMALFLDADTTRVGPVRSSRHYFLDYALEHDAIYAHCGFSPRAANDISALGVNNINEMYSNNGENFFRDKSKYAPHNLYTTIPELVKYAENNGYATETEKDGVFSYRKTDEDINGESATEISLPYHSQYVVSYTYNADEKVYERYINGEPHTSETTGEVLTAKNILVYQVENYIVDDVGRHEVENIGSGKGHYITNGRKMPITWSKTSRRGQTVYKTEDGKILEINPGNVFVQIVPLSEDITIQ